MSCCFLPLSPLSRPDIPPSLSPLGFHSPMADFDDDQGLIDFLEAEIYSVLDQDEKPLKRLMIEEGSSKLPSRIESGILGKVPPELFHHILKFLSFEDLIACSLVCRFMNFATYDERLWQRLYCLRWDVTSPTGKPRECAWKKLYIQLKKHLPIHTSERLHDIVDEPICMEPFSFEFEQHAQIEDQMKELIYNEAISFNPLYGH